MASTKIEWTEKVWNPVRGCAIVSKGCTNCYAMRQAHRFSGVGGSYEGLTKLSKGGPVWTGAIRTVPEMLEQPLRWNKPRRIFVNSMSDLFHEDVPDDFILRVFDVMRQSENGHAVKLNRLMHPHTFQILTKRAARMLDFCQRIRFAQNDDRGLYLADTKDHQGFNPMPALKHVWLGVSVEDQTAADERIPLLLDTPAAVRWISAEPLVGPIKLRWDRWLPVSGFEQIEREQLRTIDWCVVGGESGPGARPMHPDWARSLRDQCAWAGVPFFFKQWGAWAPWEEYPPGPPEGLKTEACWPNGALGYGSWGQSGGAGKHVVLVGKKKAGRQLDGRTHDEYPK